MRGVNDEPEIPKPEPGQGLKCAVSCSKLGTEESGGNMEQGSTEASVKKTEKCSELSLLFFQVQFLYDTAAVFVSIISFLL